MTEIQLIQSRLLELFKYTADFLNRHNLKYIACAGTVLGAARHQGFIPWDDDIDIYLWREDYNKLLALKGELQKEMHDVVSIETDKGYYLPFAKVIDRKTTLWAREKYPFLIGLFIDIFPLDKFEKAEDIMPVHTKSYHLFEIYQYSFTGLGFKESLKKSWSYLKEFHVFGAFYYVWRDMYNKGHQDKCVRRWKKFEKTYVGREGDYCCSPTQIIGKVFLTKWFNETITLPFEDTEIVVPEDYDAYLTELYHDWHTPPPEDKRIETHDQERYYLNLKEGLTMEEVKQRLAQGEKLVL